ncbi:hypothetical protein TWF481_003214 [Arthrobotrys musiformis]|uniref:Homologous-pairing protein 2 winged helix domain-containing protein n=1 Tax=Arthrobotrys musiformis TaxID=47236 RepID=A0AAV9VPV9_9PEZI
MILDYLQKQNRPYSATDISANLHNAVTKANAAKLLKELSDSGDLVGCFRLPGPAEYERMTIIHDAFVDLADPLDGKNIGTMMMTELLSGLCMLQMLQMLQVDIVQFEFLGSQGFPWFREDQA